MKLPPLSFTPAFAHDGTSLYLTAVSDELAEDKVDHGVILRQAGDSWQFTIVERSIASLVYMPERKALLAFCTDGEVIDFSQDPPRQITIDPSEEGPSDLVTITCAKKIDGALVAVGMARHAYLGDRDLAFSAIDDAVFVPRDIRDEAYGFLSVDGFDRDNIYASGMLGEIWSRINGVWQREHSPTNVALSRTLCTRNGRVYIAGLCGTIIEGVSGAWKCIDQDTTSADMWGICELSSDIYCSSYDGVYRLNGKTFDKCRLGDARDYSTAYLFSHQTRMWSIGHKHVYSTSDGTHWESVTVEEAERTSGIQP